MTWRTAFTNLAAISVTGVTTSYDLDDLPNTLPAADLPALAPAFPPGVQAGAGEAAGLAALTYDGTVWTSVLHIDHVLYWAPAWSEAGLSGVLPALVDAMDDYLEAVGANGTLDGALDRELEIVSVQPGVVEYGEARYYGVRFRHRWVRVIG
jgi:hypothetical protein